MKTVLFCRVSSKEQEVEGFSLASQEKLLTEYAEKQNLQIAKVFSISESASGKKQRENFHKMLEFINKNGIQVIVCEKVDRLTRNLRDAVDINEWINNNCERQVHFVKENVVLNKDSKSNEKFIWNIKVSVAQYYIDNLSEEVRKGQKQKIAEGWMPTKPPVGYKTVGEKGKKIHIIDEEKAPLVLKMFETYATGQISLKNLTEFVYKDGLRNYAGKKLVKSRIHQLLTDPFYIGKLRWNGEVYDAKHQSLIDIELFNKVQTVLKSKTTPKYRKHFYLFQGMFRCSECKGRVTWEVQKGIVYGHCNHYRACGQKLWSKEKDVEEQLVSILEQFQISNKRLADWIVKALKESHKDEIVYNSTATDELNKSVDKLQNRLDKLYDDKLDGVIDLETYSRRFKEFSEEKELLLQSINKHSNANKKYFELGINIYEVSQRAKELYGKAERDEKRKLLSLMFENLYLDEGKVSYDLSLPFKLVFELSEQIKSSKIEKVEDFEKEIFEPEEKLDISIKKDAFYSQRPILLRD